MVIDMHNDTAYRMYFENEPLNKNNFHIDLERQKGLDILPFYSIFIDPEKTNGDVDVYFYNLYNNFMSQAPEKYLLTLEGGGFIDSLSKVDILKRLNIKSVTLTWNDSNKIAASQMSGDAGGVTEFGYRVIDKMLENDIIPDLSHISDRSFYDVMEYVDRPILVTHSNSRVICDFPRNITDDMFLRVIKNEGVVGINFCCDFLGKKPDISTVFLHIEHFLSLGGENSIGFGSDFDGIPCLPTGIFDISSFPKIIEEMLKNNIKEEIVEKICYKNVQKLLTNYNLRV